MYPTQMEAYNCQFVSPPISPCCGDHGRMCRYGGEVLSYNAELPQLAVDIATNTLEAFVFSA